MGQDDELMARAIQSDREAQRQSYSKEKFAEARPVLNIPLFIEIEADAHLVVELAARCDYLNALGVYQATISKLNLLRESFEHLGKEVKTEVDWLKLALSVDFADQLKANCNCK